MKRFLLSLIALALLVAPASARNLHAEYSYGVFKSYKAAGSYDHIEGKRIKLAQILGFTSGAAIPATFTGFLDQFTGLSPTWGVSAYKLTNAYSGNWGTVERQSDGTPQTIGFLSNGNVDVASFSTFCASTNCYLTTWVDQINGINASQATLANMPRVIVDENSLLAVCPQPTSKMTTSFNSAVNTAKVHLFAVANAHTADSKWNQANLPTNVMTGNITASSSAIASMSSQTGLSTKNNLTQLGTAPGIVDSSNFIPNYPTAAKYQSYLSALPTGSTGTIGFSSGLATTTGSKTGDTLTITNAVLGGAWILNGPASSTFETSAYWGMGMANTQVGGDWNFVRNAGTLDFQNVFGNGMRGQFGVYDFDTFTTNLNYNGVNIGNITGTTSNVTYSTNVGMTLFSNPNGTENLSNSCFETMVLFPATEASRVSMAQFLMAQDGITNNNFSAPTTSDGFTMLGAYQPNNEKGHSTIFGQSAYGPDANGMTWNPQSGGYTAPQGGPSIAMATNVNNGATLYEFKANPGDFDINISGQARAEMNTTLSFAPGNHFSIYYTFTFKAYTSYTVSWGYLGQVHYNDSGLSTDAPDLVTASFLNNKIQFQTQCCVSGGIVQTTNCGSAFSFTVGTTYAVEIEGFWSANHTTDSLVVHAGPIGSSLPQVCSTSGSLWDNDTGAYLKIGVYTGFEWDVPGLVWLRQTNPQLSTTQNAFAAYITTQPAEPTHAANDNDQNSMMAGGHYEDRTNLLFASWRQFEGLRRRNSIIGPRPVRVIRPAANVARRAA